MSRQKVIHFTDCKSRFAHLAKDPTHALEDEFDVEVEWRHFSLNIASFLGAAETRTEIEWRKVRHACMDMRRWANKRGLTVRGPRRVHDSSPAGIGLQYTQEQRLFRTYNGRVFKGFWNHELEVDEVAAMTAILDEVGADGGGFAAYLAAEGRRLHDERHLKTKALGVFGLSSFLFKSEFFLRLRPHGFAA